jgi:drug/metabolite transporter (DMT)-like permease
MFTIITGQILALLGIGNGMLSTVLEKHLKIVTPFLLTSSYYFLLAILWIIISRKIKKPKMSYILITLFDSQANFLNIYAFSVVHFNYPFIINVSSVFWTCLFTWIFIRKYKYKKFHIIGVGISILGVAITLYGSLSMIDNTDKIFENMVGLSYCLGASILYSM